MLTEVSGSSKWTLGAFVTYSNEMKESAIGVPHELLLQHGAVSEPVARAMSEGARNRSGATWAAAITGIAGPEGGTPEKPVGTVWLALAGPRGTVSRGAKYRGDRGQVRVQSAYGALQLLREEFGHARLP
jgi:nicotinamide-nucleotide amidase